MGSIGLTTGLRALLTAQHALDTVGNNIANASTPGYSRQRVLLGSGLGIDRGNVLIGTGVVTKDLSRVVDDLLNRRIVGQLSVLGRLDQAYERASQIEAVFGDLQGVGVGAMLDGFFDELSSLATDPGDPVRRTAVVQSAEVLSARFNEVHAGLAEARTSTRSQAELAVGQVNDLAARIADLNLKIAETEAGQVSANGLRDERQLLLEQLAELTDVKAKDTGIGGVRVHVGGALLVDGSTTLPLQLVEGDDGSLGVQASGSGIAIKGLSGKLGALLGHGNGFVGTLQQDLDAIAKELILEVNRAHTTGVPGGGPFKKLVGASPLQLAYQGGVLAVQTLADSGLPFDVQTGSLTVNVHDLSSGEIEKHSVAVEPGMQVQELIQAISSIPGLSAHVDDAGHFTMTASPGHAFDFSNVVLPAPDVNGTFGGATASIGTGAAQPFALVNGDTLDLTVTNGGATTSFTVTLDAADFENVGAATADELAAALNGDAAFAASGAVAVAQDGRVFLQTTASGPAQELTVTGGSAVGALGLGGVVGQTVTGALDSVDVQVGGAYTGDGDQTFTLVPAGEGVVGTTPGLAVEVYDADGQLVGTLEVGEGYVPGTPLALGGGLSVSFGLGTLSAGAGDRVSIEAQADSDTSDVLVALGLNTFFEGTGAADLRVRDEIAKAPGQLAASATGSGGDNGVLLQLLALQERSLESLGGQSLGERYGRLVADVGFEVSSVEASAKSARAVLDSLVERRDSVSGVNVDEELVDMIRFERSFQAASRYIAALGELEDSILALI